MEGCEGTEQMAFFWPSSPAVTVLSSRGPGTGKRSWAMQPAEVVKHSTKEGIQLNTASPENTN